MYGSNHDSYDPLIRVREGGDLPLSGSYEYDKTTVLYENCLQSSKGPNVFEELHDTKIIPLQNLSYERLEFLGDAVIHLALAEYLYERYGDQHEGFMTRLRIKLENGNILSNISKIVGLNKYVIISKTIELANGREQNSNILEDIFEAFIGALRLNIGFKSCKQFIINIIETEIDIAKILYHETNYKDSLLQYFHKNEMADPKYKQLELSGPDHKKKFVMCVIDNNNNIIGKGTGLSKKGEQEAARNALIYYGIISENNEESEDEIVYI